MATATEVAQEPTPIELPTPSDSRQESSARGQTVIRITTVLVVVIVAAVAAVISFSHLYHLALEHGQSGLAARLTPISVDATILAASLSMLDAARRQVPAPRLARGLLIAGIGATIAGNLVYGFRFGIIGALVSGWPAAALIGCMELIISMIRSAHHSEQGIDPEDGPLPGIHQTFADEIAQKVVPSIRDIKKRMRIGQDRAEVVQKWLEFLSQT